MAKCGTIVTTRRELIEQYVLSADSLSKEIFGTILESEEVGIRNGKKENNYMLVMPDFKTNIKVVS